MASDVTTSDRVLLLMNLVPYLTEHGPTSVADLASAFRVEEKLIRRLATFLGTAGVPGETRTYQSEDLFDIDWDALELHDVVSLTQVVAIDEPPRFSSAESAALIAGLHALLPMLTDSQRMAAEEAARKLGSAKSVEQTPTVVSISQDPEDAQLATVLEAMAAHVRLSFEYRDDRGTHTRRTVEPLGLTQAGGTWYLRAHCLTREASRTFVVHRMRNAVVSGEPATHLEEPTTALTSHFSPEGAESVIALLEVSRSALHRLADFLPRIVSEEAPHSVLVEIELAHPEVAIRLVQSAPGEVTVRAPEAARAAVRDWADRALASYDG